MYVSWKTDLGISYTYIYIYIYRWQFKTLLILWYVLMLLKIGCSHMHYAVFWGYGGGSYYSVTRGIVVLFCVHIGAVLLLRNASFCTFVCFRHNLCCCLEWLYLLSIVDSLEVLILLNNQHDAALSSLFIIHCKITVHVSGAFCTNHQEYN
jgi:hypothetical protein